MPASRCVSSVRDRRHLPFSPLEKAGVYGLVFVSLASLQTNQNIIVIRLFFPKSNLLPIYLDMARFWPRDTVG